MGKLNKFKNILLALLNTPYNDLWEVPEINQTNVEPFIMMIYSFSNYTRYNRIKHIILLFFMHLLDEEKNYEVFFTTIILKGGIDIVTFLFNENILTSQYTINKQKLDEYVNNDENNISVPGLQQAIDIFNNSYSS